MRRASAQFAGALALTTTLAVSGAAATSATAAAGVAPNQLAPNATATADGPIVPPEVMHLAAERNLSTTAAAARISWQTEVMRLRPDIERLLGASLGGMYIGRDDDRPKVAVAGAVANTAMTLLKPLLSGTVLDGVLDIVPVKHSLASLTAVRDKLRGELETVNAEAIAPVEVVLREQENRTRLLVPPGVTLTSAQKSFIEQTLADQRVVREDRATTGTGRVCAQQGTLVCDAPLRGGQSYKTFQAPDSNCTVGFNTRAPDGAAYVIGAGHCYLFAGVSGADAKQPSTGSFHRIGDKRNAYWGPDGDYGITRINNDGATGWNIRAWVAVTDSASNGGVPGTTRNESYAISGDEATMPDMRICTTGAFYARTSCGRVFDTDTPFTYTVYSPVTGTTDTRRVEHLARGTFCGVGGDSGAPMFAGGKAIGLQVAGAAECDSFYQGIRGALSAMGVRVATGS